MEIRLLSSPGDLRMYDAWIKAHPQGSLWQSPEWKTYQEALGRKTRVYAALENESICGSALVTIDTTALGLCTWEIGRGPLEVIGDRELGIEVLLQRIVGDAKKEKCLSLFFSPTHPLPPTPNPLRPSPRHIHPEATRILDLTASEDDILAQMKPKGRYNIKVAEKNGVTVRPSDDAAAFHALMQKTGERDRFGILPKSHYAAFLQTIPGALLLLAYAPSQSPTPNPQSPIAGLIGVIWNGKGIYYYGASLHEHRALMAPYALQWAAMRHCKAAGCASYDLLGVAPPDAGPSHPWQGISAFKEKFGGAVVTYPHESEIRLRPALSWLLGMKRKVMG